VITAALPKPKEAGMDEMNDLRLEAFLSPNSPEVFHSVATPTAMWQPDPFDIETIHTQARETFSRLLARASRADAVASGSILVLLGEAGSGKTHLMRAFRNHTHTGGNGYCGYMQMTTETSNYPRYMLNNLLDGLEQPYTPESNKTGLTRISSALLEAVPNLSPEERYEFRNGGGDAVEAIDGFVARLQKQTKYQQIPLEMLRVLLHLERDDFGVRSRALMWLRCQDMTQRDRAWIGDEVARTDDADPDRMLQGFAKIIRVVHEAPLVILVDQLEDLANQSASAERFQKVVDTITTITYMNPNSNVVVVLACLEDYFKENESKLHASKRHRLTADPAPIRLSNNCDTRQIRAIAATRLRYLYERSGIEVSSERDLYPFEQRHLDPLSGFSPRQVLLFLLQHHRKCLAAGRWFEPGGVVMPPLPPPPTLDYDLHWNDFLSTFPSAANDDDGDLASILAGAIRDIESELPEGNHFGRPCAEGRFLELELHKPEGSIDKLLVAVCNGKTNGNGLINQIKEVTNRAGDFAVAFLRNTKFPQSGKAMQLVAPLLKKDGHTIVVPDSDWRRMLAFAAFREKHCVRPDFAAWQKEARPLGELASLQKLLRLNSLKPSPRNPIVVPEEDPTPPAGKVTVSPPVVPPIVPPIALTSTTTLTLGDTVAAIPTPVNFEPLEFTYHAAFLGGTGSGKTTAALNLIEQLLSQGVSAVLLDRKGDLCRYADDAAWERPLPHQARTDARRKLREKLDISVYTPGDAKGRPLALPVVPPGFEQLPEADREKFAMYAATALGSMLNFKAGDTDQGQRVILAKAIETLASIPDSKITIGRLRQLIAEQDDTLMGMLGGGYPEPYFSKLAIRLNTLELSNKSLLEGGELLDIETMLGSGVHHKPGRAKLTIISTRFLGGDAATDFWVSQFLIAISRYCAKNPKPYLQAVFLFDEADKYLPATRKPATKEPMEDLLKRARSAGVGIFLGTQSPGDLDYKCKENLRTWFIGRVKEPTAIEKLKPMLAAAKGDVSDKLAGLPTGQFLLVRESNVVPMKSFQSFLKTEQQSEAEILELARRGQPARK